MTNSVGSFLSLVKFSHTIFAMPFALIGYFMAVRLTEFGFEWKLLALVILCMVFARNAAMAFNRFIDRKFDGMNPRTAIREIPSGIISTSKAVAFIVINCILFVLCAWLINPLCFYLSPVALAVVLGYSLTKRFTFLCHLVLGLGLSLAPIGAYIAVTGEFNLLPILFSGTVLFWVSGFDIIYALQDESFDRNIGLKSIPVWLGTKNALHLSSFLHFLTFLFIVSAGFIGSFGVYYWVGVMFFSSLLVYQHSLVKPDDLSKVNIAFFTTNGVASLIFAILTITDLYLG